MIIVFRGTTIDLMKRLEQFSNRDEQATLYFMLENFEIMKRQPKEILRAIYNDEKTTEEIDNAATQI